MRSKLLAPLALVIVVGVAVAFVATRGQSCDDVFARSESRLQPVTDRAAEDQMPEAPGGGVGPEHWVLSTGEADFGPGLVEVGGWTAYVNRSEISRIDGDGTIRWTRATPRARAEPLGQGRLGVAAVIDARQVLAVIDPAGQLLRCDDLGSVGGGVTGDGTGGYATVGGTPGQGVGEDEAIDVARRVEADGSERWAVELGPRPGRFVDEVLVGGGLTVVGRTDPIDGVVITAFDDVTGELLWTIDGRDPAILPVETLLGVVDDQLYVGVQDRDVGAETETILAVDVATGEILWSTPAVFDGFGGEVIGVGDAVVLTTSANTASFDPRAGAINWTVTGGFIAIDRGRQGATIRTVDGRPLYPSASGLLIDLIDGRSGLLFDAVDVVILESLALDGDALLTLTAVRGEGTDLVMFVSGWSFEPEAAVLDEEPTRPEAP